MKHLDNAVIDYDNHLLILNKACGCNTQLDQGESLQAFGKKWLKERFQKAGGVFLEPVHRLDKPVSGLVLFARTSKALKRLNAFVREKRLTKRYYALVEGELFSGQTLVNHLRRRPFKTEVVECASFDTKEARLTFQVMQTLEKETLLEVELETGRYHQIRAQLSHLGHPIKGDEKYGAKTLVEEGIYLHHAHLECPHPITQEMLVWETFPHWMPK